VWCENWVFICSRNPRFRKFAAAPHLPPLPPRFGFPDHHFICISYLSLSYSVLQTLPFPWFLFHNAQRMMNGTNYKVSLHAFFLGLFCPFLTHATCPVILITNDLFTMTYQRWDTNFWARNTFLGKLRAYISKHILVAFITWKTKLRTFI
jgi:hypothetical protein